MQKINERVFLMLEKVDAIELVQEVLKKWWVPVILSLVFGMTSYGYSKYIQEKEYVSVGRMYIDTYRNGKNESDGGDSERNTAAITASQRSVLTCIEVLKSTRVLEQVSEMAEEKGYRYSASNIRNRVTMASANETEVLKITVTTNDPVHAKFLVDAIMKVGEKELVEIVGVTTAKVIDEGTDTKVAVSPNVRIQSMVGFALGFVIGVLIIIFIRLLDTRIKSEEELKNFNVPIIGVIPEMD